MARCLVTGGAGLIGSHLASHLLKDGHQVIILDDLSTGDIRNIPSSADFINQPLEKADVNVFSNIDVVFHLASISGEAVSLYAPTTCFNRNIEASQNLLVNSLNSGVKRIVFASSMAVYGNRITPPFNEDDLCDPTDPYGLYKFTIEKLLQIYGEHSSLEWTILRLHNVYGPNMNLTDPFRGVISIIINRLLHEKPPILYGNGNQLRAFTYVEDIVPFIAKAGFNEECNKQIINLGSGRKTRLLDLAKILCKLTGYTNEILYFPQRLSEAEDAYTTTEKSERLLGFKDKTSLHDGLSYTLNWARKQEIKSFDYGLLQIDLDLGSLPSTWKNHIL